MPFVAIASQQVCTSSHMQTQNQQAVNTAVWAPDGFYDRRIPLVTNQYYRIVSAYNGTVTGSITMSYISIECAGLARLYVIIDGDQYLQYEGPGSGFTSGFITPVMLSAGPHKITLRGDPLPNADFAYARFVAFGGSYDQWSIYQSVVKRPIADALLQGGVVNMSTRTVIHPSEDTITGFVVTNDDPQAVQGVLVRVVGQGLGQFHVSNLLSDPYVAVYDSSGNKVSENSGWDPSMQWVFSAVGAFPLTSSDCAVIVPCKPGSYTVKVKAFGSGTGTALLEVYQLPDNVWGKG